MEVHLTVSPACNVLIPYLETSLQIAFVRLLRKPLSVIGATHSMSWAGNCYDNATIEAFFNTLKTECFPDNQVFSSWVQARREIFEYIEVYYNNRRLHSALGYQTPCQYETKFNRVMTVK
jgi:transposase InsO family protein